MRLLTPFPMRVTMRSLWKISLYLSLCMFLLAGCTPRHYGVVLWSEQDSVLQNGAVVRVSSSVDSDGAVTAFGDNDERYLLREWQVERFRSQEELDQFLSEYTPYQHIFAQCEKKALPIRTDADRFSDILYRLDSGEIIKVLDRGDEMTDEGGLEDYWYYVLTASGMRGWVFGYHLSVIDSQRNAIVTGKEARDNIASFLNAVWRPAYFIEMRDENVFDLTRFDTRYGLFPAPLEKNIQIHLPDYYFEVYYSVPRSENANSFYFGDNNELNIMLVDEQTVIASIDTGTEIMRFTFNLFPDDVQQIVNIARAEQRASAQ